MSDERATFELDAQAGVATLRLTRPAQHNAIDAAMVTALQAATEQLLGVADRTRALLIAADGPSFTVGGDLAHLHGHADRLANELVEMIGPYHRCLLAISELAMPVVCAVQGAAAGGGLGLVWCADIVVAAENATFTTGFSRLGVSGDGGSSWYLPRLLGVRRAAELLLESRTLDARTALDWGLVNRVVGDDELAEEADRTVRHFAAGPTIGLGTQRALMRAAGDRTLAEGYTAELEAMRVTGATRDVAEGMAAFLERRRPGFEAR